jgi:2-polyprenyl-3-methyl-5-hydroxy-6-metoxy-1,4-benzoquinol methylase
MDQQQQMVNPQPIFEIMTAFQRSAALKAAIELGLFTAISDGNRTAAAIAVATGASERGIRILADAITVYGFLTKTDGEYSLNDLSGTFLDRNSPAYMGDAVTFLMSDTQMAGFAGLTQAVRQGGTVVTSEGSEAPESPMWVKFARGMAPMMYPPSQMIAARLGFAPDHKFKVLDIAAGHGMFGIAVAQHFPGAEIHAVDWANVLTVATENAERVGVADRHHLIEGSAFDVDYGTGYDVILLTNFLHHFDPATCESLLRKLHGALDEDGQVITLEFIPNPDRVSPPMEALFSLVMLAGTNAGDAYTFAELKQMAENAGFSRNEHVPLPPLPQHLVISRK